MKKIGEKEGKGYDRRVKHDTEQTVEPTTIGKKLPSGEEDEREET